MTVDVQFSPLESLLIFQGLTAWGTEPDAFTKVSDSLNQCAFLQNDHLDVKERWSPRSIQNLYLQLLKAESSQELTSTNTAEESHANTNDGSASRKRKASSPTLPTLEEASKHANLMPKLVSKLYIRYRDETIRSIKEEEARYEGLVKDVKRLEENGEEVVADERAEMIPPPQEEIVKSEHALPPGDVTKEIEKTALPEDSDVVMQDAPGDTTAKTQGDLAVAEDTALATQNVSSIDFVKSLQSQSVPVAERVIISHQQQEPNKVNVERSVQSEVLPSPQTNTGLQKMSPALFQADYDLGEGPLHAHSGSKHVPLPLHSGSMGTSGMPPPYIPTGPPRTQPSFPPPVSNLTPRPPVPTYYSPQQNVPYMSQQPGGPWTQSPYNPHHPANLTHTPQPRPILPPHRGGIMLPPFQVSPQIPGPVQQQGRLSTSLLPSPYSMKIDTNSSATHTPNAFQTPTTARRRPKSRLSQVLTPKPGAVMNSGSATVWESTPATQTPVFTPTPYTRSLSPVDNPKGRQSAMSVAEVDTPKPATKKRGRTSKSALKNVASEQTVNSVSTPLNSKPAASRRTTKSPSAAGISQVRQTRSQSIISQSEHQTLTNAATAKLKVKDEEPSTPAALIDAPTEQDSTTTAPVRLTKKGVPFKTRQPRASITKDKEPPSSTQPSPTPASLPEADPQPVASSQQPLRPPTPPTTTRPQTTTVLASRNFSRMTAPIMNNITSHKHASLFAAPVKERDAEGYASMIRRPQDLKSIRNAISAGSRAVALAATSTSANIEVDGLGLGSGGGGGNGGSTTTTSMIQLPLSTDLLPPRGIVNAAQLEQEIMRMFANAVMFNPGDLGVVRDAREMCEGVEEAVAKWRAADRTVGGGGGGGSGGGAGGSGGIGFGMKAMQDEEADELGAGHGGDESVLSVGTPASVNANASAGTGLLPPAAKRRRTGA